MTRPAYVPDSAEDVTNHGIGRDYNPNDPSLSDAQEVLNALHSAMDAAGPNGSIFVPEGTYYFGSEDVYSLIELGEVSHAASQSTVRGLISPHLQ
ncbi:hypothetical protein ACODNH_22095 [Haloarcula sp. NS06]|uniref:hypothetical protein n=1 Tax=Haloarcula sp. NS06 TaxID=3409688 RepID=UPI003DA6ED00